MAKRRKKRRKGLHGTGCHPSGLKKNGKLKKGFRWAHGRHGCAIAAK